MILPCALFRICLFSPIGMHFVAAWFVSHRQDFREVSLYDNIFIIMRLWVLSSFSYR